MSKDPRHAFDTLVVALERHLEVAMSLEGDVEDSEVLIDAENKLRDAFFTYDDSLFTTTGVELPFDILDDDLDDEELEDDEDDDYLDEDELEDFDLNSED